MSTLTANGARVASGTVTIPFYGAWSADLVMADGVSLAGSVTLAVGDLTLVGTVVRQAVFAGSLTARIVGGAAGWRNTLPAKGYSHVIGVKLSTVLSDAASECGESVDVDSDRSLGSHFARDEATAQQTLDLLSDGGRWWVNGEGVTQLGERSTSPIVTPFTVVSWSGARGQFEIASETLRPWQPGRTFTTNTVPTAQTISSVTIEASNDGKVRLHVLSTDAGTSDRLRAAIRSIIRAELSAILYAGVWEYTISASLGLGLTTTIDCTPTDPRMPALTRVPIFGMGVVVPPVTGAACRIRFVNCDPSRPECIAFDGTTEHAATVESTALLLYNVFYAMSLVVPAPAGVGVLLQPFITPAIIAAMAAMSIPAPPGLIAQIAAAAATSSGMITGTVPSNTSAPFAVSIQALSTKMPDVSGLFPGLGVPNG